MSCHPRVTEWMQTIQAYMPHVSKPQATVLALWSLGMVLARSGALTAVRAFLAPWLGRKEHTVRQQWRECCYEAAAKRGPARAALRVETCFLPLLAWVVSWWQGTQERTTPRPRACLGHGTETLGRTLPRRARCMDPTRRRPRAADGSMPRTPRATRHARGETRDGTLPPPEDQRGTAPWGASGGVPPTPWHRTLALTCCWKRERRRSGRYKQSGAVLG